MLQAALNGERDHPALPRTPDELAAEGRAAVEAGAHVLHLHPYDDPGTPISLSTSADIEPDPERRHALVAAWSELPELVTANQGEQEIGALCELLFARGIGVEAGLLSLDDASAFVASGLASRCTRALLEPLDPLPDDATAHAAAMEAELADAGIRLAQVHHGDGIASWAVNARAAARGHGIRTGLEDTLVLPDGRTAAGNAELVAAAAALSAPGPG